MNAFCSKPISECEWAHKYGSREFQRDDVKIEAIMPSELCFSAVFKSSSMVHTVWIISKRVFALSIANCFICMITSNHGPFVEVYKTIRTQYNEVEMISPSCKVIQ